MHTFEVMFVEAIFLIIAIAAPISLWSVMFGPHCVDGYEV
jgi:hypothetical protein